MSFEEFQNRARLYVSGALENGESREFEEARREFGQPCQHVKILNLLWKMHPEQALEGEGLPPGRRGVAKGGLITRLLVDHGPRPLRQSVTSSWLHPDRWRSFGLGRGRPPHGHSRLHAQSATHGQGL